ncbi:MAG TPA: hypothetical protein VII99_09395 [Bacteroidia bacterium]
MDVDAMNKAFGDEPPTAYVKGGKEYIVIGVYPEEVAIDKSEIETEPSEFDKSHSREGKK